MKKPCFKIGQKIHLKDPLLDDADKECEVLEVNCWDENNNCWLIIDTDKEERLEKDFEEYTETRELQLPSRWFCEKDEEVCRKLQLLFPETTFEENVRDEWNNYHNDSHYKFMGVSNDQFEINKLSFHEEGCSAKRLSKEEIIVAFDSFLTSSVTTKTVSTTQQTSIVKTTGFAAISSKNASKRSLF